MRHRERTWPVSRRVRKLDPAEFATVRSLTKPRSVIMGNPMLKPLDPFRFLLISLAGWMNQQELQVIDQRAAK